MAHLPLKIFFSGIAGSGMSAIAAFMADKGHVVVGSDRSFDQNPSQPLINLLKAKGILLVPQDGTGIDRSFDFAVFSTAVEPDQPEVTKAKAVGIPMKTRPLLLAEIVTQFDTIAVAGTSGKSTTAGMLAFLMQRLGMKPNYIGGGRVRQFRTPNNPGNALTGDSGDLVIEACESDGTIIHYKPLHSFLLNLDLDHHSVDETGGLFQCFVGNTRDEIFSNADDENLKRLTLRNSVTFSITSPSDYKAGDVVHRHLATDFVIRGTRFSLSLPGRHNLYNALPCIGFLHERGVPLADIAAILPAFTGIERRFDLHFDDGKRLVINDYAHNPHKIASLIETVQGVRNSICYIFQPHGFGPTRMMRREYVETFTKGLRDSDHLILLPIFYAGGTADKGISSRDLAEDIRSAGRSAEVIEKRGKILDRISKWNAYVVFGARDDTLSGLADAIARKMEACIERARSKVEGSSSTRDIR